MKAQKDNNLLRNQKGFTLIEIIAVLIILGILAAIAIPKYMGLQEEARNSAAKGQIAEVKGRLSQAMAKYMLQNSGVKPTAALLVLVPTTTGGTDYPCTAIANEEFVYACTEPTTTTVVITVTAVQGATLTTAQTGTFYIGT